MEVTTRYQDRALEIRRGDIVLVKLPDVGTSRQNGRRPVIITSNELCNKYSPVLSGVSLTTRNKKRIPTHVELDINDGVEIKSIALTEQIMTIERIFIIEVLGHITDFAMRRIEKGMKIQLDMSEPVDIGMINKSLNLINKIDKMLSRYAINDYDEDISDLVYEKNLLMGELKYTCEQHGINIDKIISTHMNKNKIQGDGINGKLAGAMQI